MTNLRQQQLVWRLSVLAAAMLIALSVTAQPVAAQAPTGNSFGSQSIRRPTVSPYLNLFRTGDPGIDFALDYQKLVRPEQELRRATANLNNRVNRLQRQVNGSINPDGSLILPGTGHTTTFMNTGRYFPGARRR